MQWYYNYDSPIGVLTAIGEGEFLTQLRINGERLDNNYNKNVLGFKVNTDSIENIKTEKNLPAFTQTKIWLDNYFGGKKPDFIPPILPEGTDFRKLVWEIILSVPYGETISYKEIAKKIEKKKGITKMSAQAVGGAVGSNPIAIIIPCHRVIGSNRSLVGYAAGLETKIKLLEIENIKIDNFNIVQNSINNI